MPNFMMFEKTTDRGSTSLGKYTLPKMPALLTNVVDVAVKQDEK
jgi:hypothetical protein